MDFFCLRYGLIMDPFVQPHRAVTYSSITVIYMYIALPKYTCTIACGKICTLCIIDIMLSKLG